MYTDRQTDTQTDRHTDNDEYSIVAVDKPQLYSEWKGSISQFWNTVGRENLEHSFI